MSGLFYQVKKNLKGILYGGKSMCEMREVRNSKVVLGNCKQFVARVRVNNKNSSLIYELGL